MKWHHFCMGKYRQRQCKEQSLHIYESTLFHIPISHVRKSFTRAVHALTIYSVPLLLGIRRQWHNCVKEHEWMCSRHSVLVLPSLTLGWNCSPSKDWHAAVRVELYVIQKEKRNLNKKVNIMHYMHEWCMITFSASDACLPAFPF